MRHKHYEDPALTEALRSCRQLWAVQAPFGVLTGYSTASGLAVFLDFDSNNGGWTLLTECPAGKKSINAEELQAMIAGDATVRGREAGQ